MVPITETTMAAHRGTRCRSIQVNTGHRSAVTRIATRSGTTRSFNWMTSQMRMPAATAITTNRHA
jgi:hypothetical protein